jgi:hypothetical protein
MSNFWLEFRSKVENQGASGVWFDQTGFANYLFGIAHLSYSVFFILYIYGPWCKEKWRFTYPKKSYFSIVKPERNMTSAGKQTFISPYNKGRKLFIIPKLHTKHVF